MFQLIVAVISIALVAALAIASIYYGGTAFSSSSIRANVVTLVNGGQQIAGANALYKTDTGADVADGAITNMPVAYLASAPGISSVATGAWTIATTTGTKYAVVGIKPASLAAVTAEVNTQNNGGTQFVIDGSNFKFKL